MNYERLLGKLVEFINSQTQETDVEMRRLWAKESKIELMDLHARLEYLEAVAEARGKIALLQAIKDYYDSLVEERPCGNA